MVRVYLNAGYRSVHFKIKELYRLRLPHANVRVLASGILRPLVTTLFFGDPTDERQSDPILGAVTDVARRNQLFAVRDETLDAGGLPAYRFDIVLRGERETPFFLD